MKKEDLIKEIAILKSAEASSLQKDKELRKSFSIVLKYYQDPNTKNHNAFRHGLSDVFYKSYEARDLLSWDEIFVQLGKLIGITEVSKQERYIKDQDEMINKLGIELSNANANSNK
jgi:hypothetical protein